MTRCTGRAGSREISNHEMMFLCGPTLAAYAMITVQVNLLPD